MCIYYEYFLYFYIFNLLEEQINKLAQDHHIELGKDDNQIKDLEDKVYNAEQSLQKKEEFQNKFKEL